MLLRDDQDGLCRKYGTAWVEAPSHLKVGISKTALSGVLPLNGLRHPPEGDTTGWYLWGGDVVSDAADYFEPLCVEHLQEHCPAALRYLGLPPGWRFLLTGDHEDVWEDRSLLVL